jgi:hypothetical protein
MIVAAAAASTAATMISATAAATTTTTTAAAAVIVTVTAVDGRLGRRYVDNNRLRRTIPSAVLCILVLGLGRRHLCLRLSALDLALLVVPVSTTTVASAVIVGERFQRASAEEQARHAEHGDDRQSSGSGHFPPPGTTLIQP